MRVIVVHCPHCGARLESAKQAESVRCSYCDTVAHIQPRSRVLQVPAHLPDNLPMPIARQRFSLLALLPIVGVLVVIVGGVVFMTIGRGLIERRDLVMWSGEVPTLVDVDGDGEMDLIGIVRHTLQDDRAHLVAHSGKTGKQLWESESLGTFSGLGQQLIGSTPDLILIASDQGTLTARDKLGKERWQVTFSEKVEEMCAGSSPAEIVVVTADRKWYGIDGDGNRSDHAPMLRFDAHTTTEIASTFALPSVTPSDACIPISNVAWRGAPGLLTLKKWRTGIPIPGMEVDRYIRRASGPTVAVGYKTPGSSVRRLVLLDHESARWSAEIPAIDPLSSKADEQHVTLSDRAAFALYQPKSPALPRLTAFELATGKRLWDVEMTIGRSFSANGLRVTGQTLLVATWGGLRGHDVVDGHERFLIGER